MMKDLKRNYYTDTMANYLILRCPEESREGYQYRMLAANRIKGLLPCSMRCIDGESYLYYEITSRQSLARLYDHGMISCREMKQILYALTGMFRDLSEYLLDNSRLLLDPEYVFYDYETDRFCFTYYPEKMEDAGIQGLLEYLAEKSDPKSADSTAVIYHLCDLSGRPGFILRDELLDHEFEQMKAQAQEESDGENEQNSPRRYSDRRDPDLWEEGSENRREGAADPEEELFEGGDRGRAGRIRNRPGRSGGKEWGAGRSLILAVGFFLAAAIMEAVRFLIPLKAESLLALRAGAIACLLFCLAAAARGILSAVRKSRKSAQEQRQQEEQKQDEMVPAEEFPSAQTGRK